MEPDVAPGPAPLDAGDLLRAELPRLIEEMRAAGEDVRELSRVLALQVADPADLYQEAQRVLERIAGPRPTQRSGFWR